MLKWLKRCCQKATAPAEKQQVLDWEAMRPKLWAPDETNHFAHLRLSDFSDEVAALPPGEMPVCLHSSDDCFLMHLLLNDNRLIAPSFLSKSPPRKGNDCWIFL